MSSWSLSSFFQFSSDLCMLKIFRIFYSFFICPLNLGMFWLKIPPNGLNDDSQFWAGNVWTILTPFPTITTWFMTLLNIFNKRCRKNFTWIKYFWCHKIFLVFNYFYPLAHVWGMQHPSDLTNESQVISDIDQSEASNIFLPFIKMSIVHSRPREGAWQRIN